jgi:hypothetical protein
LSRVSWIDAHIHVFENSREFDLQLIEWRAGPMVFTNADVLIFWQVRRILPHLTLLEATEELIEVCFDGGATYTPSEIAAAVSSLTCQEQKSVSELSAERAAAIARARTIIGISVAESRPMSQTEEKEFDALLALAEKLKHKLSSEGLSPTNERRQIEDSARREDETTNDDDWAKQ